MDEKTDKEKAQEAAIVDAVLKEQEKKIVTPSSATVDPTYAEPYPIEKYKEMAALMQKEGDTLETWAQAQKLYLQQRVLIDFLINRVGNLERALVPFATMALQFANARMCLTATGSKDPAGGTWMSNPPNGIRMTANESMFFEACDVLGRARVEQVTVEAFERIQAAAKHQADKDQHIENGGTLH